jgi:2-haloalkanoic acid dehalogenase type II
MRLTDFSALSFDCYGTLIDWETGLVNAFEPWRDRTEISVTDDQLLAQFGEIESRVQVENPTMLYPETLGVTLREIGGLFSAAPTDVEAKNFSNSIKNWPAFADTSKALAYLKDFYRLVIVSNVDNASFKFSNAKLGVEFDFVVTAEDVGSYKPAHGHFERALELLSGVGIDKSQVLHVAQSLYHDHVPAKELGLKTVWANRRAAKGGQGGAAKAPAAPVKPDLEVQSLAALVGLHRAEVAKNKD